MRVSHTRVGYLCAVRTHDGRGGVRGSLRLNFKSQNKQRAKDFAPSAAECRDRWLGVGTSFKNACGKTKNKVL